MNARMTILAALAATGLAGPCSAAPLEVYGKLPTIESVSISPDGSMLALAVTNGDQRRIVVEQFDTGKTIANLNAGEQKVRLVQWAGEDHLIVTVSSAGHVIGAESDRNEWFVATDFNITKKTQRSLLNGINVNDDHIHPDQDSLNVLYGAPEIRIIDGKPFAFAQGVSFVQNQGRLTMFKVDLDRGATDIESRDVQTSNKFIVNADGVPLASSNYDAPKSRWTLKFWNGQWQEAQSRQSTIDPPELMGLGRDDASVVVVDFESGLRGLREYSQRGDPAGEVLPLGDPDRLIFDPATHRLIGAEALVGDEKRYQFLDTRNQKVWDAITAAYPHDVVTLESNSDDRRRFVVRVDSPTDSPAYALVDLTTGKGKWVGEEYQGLKASDIAPAQPISYKARDGLGLSGYLTIPNGKIAKNLPLVVLPHSSAEVRDEPGFNWWAQALASRGYAVLQVNQRGSYGFGSGFKVAGYGQLGRRMQTDLSDGVRYLSAQGVIDPARACIVGSTYGGYAALAGAVFDPGVYRCAASVSGMADLRRYVDWRNARGGRQGVGSERYLLQLMGAYDSLEEISPAAHADKVAIPILLVHGKDDTVVPFEQSEMMADALRKAGKSVEFVALKGEDHWLSRGDTRLQMLQAVTAFLEKNNPP